jgi:glycosyltransferase involved in cell wall biosynthesis
MSLNSENEKSHLGTPIPVLFICKRFYMGKDVLTDRYGRLFHFPYQLARLGFKVTCLLTDYHLKSRGQHLTEQDGVTWLTVPISRFARLLTEGAKLARQAEVIVGSSDCLQIGLAYRLSRRSGRPFVADLYDNYESFGLANIPGARQLYRRALREADAITCVSSGLRLMLDQTYGLGANTFTLNSTIEVGQFFTGDQAEARASLGLPARERLVGVCGGLSPDRGIGNFYRAMEELWGGGEQLKLVLAGSLHKDEPPPDAGQVIFLGDLPLSQMNAFYNAMDVNVLQYVDNEFGRFAYPQKLEELVATARPLVAANVGEMARRFIDTPAVLYNPDDIESIKQAILRQLDSPTPYDTTTQSWEEVGSRLGDILREVQDGWS